MGPNCPVPTSNKQSFLKRLIVVGTHDIEDGINMMLGRDANLPRPPVLAWGPLRAVLSAAGFHLTDQDLIALPLRIDFSEELIAAIQTI
jgi:hypothetical protein